MMHNNKWLTRKQAYDLAVKVAAKKNISFQELADILGISHTTIYRWKNGSIDQPDVRITESLKDIAFKEGILKA